MAVMITVEIEKKMRAAARRFGPLADDAYQEMALYAVERGKPTDTAAFLVWKARLHALRALGLDGQRKQSIFEAAALPLAFADEDGEIVEIDAADPQAVAALDEIDLAELLAALPSPLRLLASKLAEGATMAQAADELGISRQLANYRRKQLAKRLAPVYGLAA